MIRLLCCDEGAAGVMEDQAVRLCVCVSVRVRASPSSWQKAFRLACDVTVLATVLVESLE